MLCDYSGEYITIYVIRCGPMWSIVYTNCSAVHCSLFILYVDSQYLNGIFLLSMEQNEYKKKKKSNKNLPVTNISVAITLALLCHAEHEKYALHNSWIDVNVRVSHILNSKFENWLTNRIVCCDIHIFWTMWGVSSNSQLQQEIKAHSSRHFIWNKNILLSVDISLKWPSTIIAIVINRRIKTASMYNIFIFHFQPSCFTSLSEWYTRSLVTPFSNKRMMKSSLVVFFFFWFAGRISVDKLKACHE